ncbi:putative phage tail protein [Arthrobacter pigmenti]|uniref:Putative phage tail protein n=1 Tax=Arthrobacter pigmenti TaxID=271432 RepID=A0A846RIS3_9MICC|nr:hypothetical protein [Arthrobacter pigmenti]NJC23188.1 putative phage tail protein [Arthrobacter pigmenti]
MSSIHTTNHDDGATRVRPGTIIWGVVTIVIGALILAGALTDIMLDPVLVVMALLIGTGLSLVVGGVLSMTRRERKVDRARRLPPSS